MKYPCLGSRSLSSHFLFEAEVQSVFSLFFGSVKQGAAAQKSPPGRALKTESCPNSPPGRALKTEGSPTIASRAGAESQNGEAAQKSPPGRALKEREWPKDASRAGSPRFICTRDVASNDVSLIGAFFIFPARCVSEKVAPPKSSCLPLLIVCRACWHAWLILLTCVAGCCVAHSAAPRGTVVATARLPGWATVEHVHHHILCRRSCHAGSPLAHRANHFLLCIARSCVAQRVDPSGLVVTQQALLSGHPTHLLIATFSFVPQGVASSEVWSQRLRGRQGW